MPIPSRQSAVRRFGSFEADLSARELRKQGLIVRLQDQPYQILVLLLERVGEIVTREEIQQRLWPNNTFVEFDNGLNVAIKKLRTALNDDADSPRYVETVPRRGYRFIASVSVVESPVLASNVVAESSVGESVVCQSVLLPDVLPDISAKVEPSQTGVHATGRVWWAAAVLLLLGGGFLWAHYQRSGIASNPLSIPVQAHNIVPRRSVAVLVFRNGSGRAEEAWLSTALSEMLSTELAAGDRLRMVSGEDVAHWHSAASSPETDSVSKETAQHLRDALGSDFLVTGSYTVLAGGPARQLRLDVRLQNAASGEILTEVAENGQEDKLFRLVGRVGERLRQKLGAPEVSGQEQEEALASAPSNAEADRFYAVGLSKLRDFDAMSARDLLQQAVAADPQYPLSHSALSSAWTTLGYDEKARAEAKRAYDLAGPLLPTEKLVVEGRYREATSDWSKAASVYGTLFSLYPDSLDYGLLLARAQYKLDQFEPAEATVGLLRRLPPPVSADPRIDLTEADIVNGKDDPRELKLLQDAERKAQSLGLKLVYARARSGECLSLVWGAHPQSAIAACEDAQQIFLSAGDRRHAAITLRQMADRHSDQGQYPEALRLYAEVLKTFREIGDRGNAAAVLNNQGLILQTQNNLDRAGRAFTEAAAAFRDTGESGNYLIAMSNFSDVRAAQGDLAGAARIRERMLKIARSTHNPARIAAALWGLATSREMSGNLAEARAMTEEGIGLCRQTGATETLITGLGVLGGIKMEQGDLSGGRHDYEEGLALEQQRNAAGAVAESKWLLAELSLEEGNAAQAVILLQQAIPEFESEKAAGALALAQTSLGRARLMQGTITEAKQAAANAARSSQGTADPTVTMPLAILQARLLAAEDGPASARAAKLRLARAQLQRVVTSARKISFFDEEYHGRLALGEVEMEITAALGRPTLTSLEQSASLHGFQLLARQAAAMRESQPKNASTLASRRIN